MDNDDTITLLRELDNDSFGPPVVDLDAAMRVGRKRQVRRRLAGAATSVTAVAAIIAVVPITIHQVRGAVSANEAEAPKFVGPSSLTCVEYALPVPQPGLMSITDAADPTGRYVVGRVGKSDYKSLQEIQNGRQVVIWHDRKIVTTFTPPGDDEVVISGINSHGAVVGAHGAGQHGWVYADGAMTVLPGSIESDATAINEHGEILGDEYPADLSPGSVGRVDPVIWHSATSNPVRLKIPKGYSTATASGIDSDGTVIGTLETAANDRFVGVLWRPSGSVQLLPKPSHLAGVSDVTPLSIRNGVVVAVATIPTSTGIAHVALLYSVKTGKYRELPHTESFDPSPHTRLAAPPASPPSVVINPVGGIRAAAGNAHGWLVGGSGDGHSVLYTPNSGNVRLPTHLEISAGLYTDSPNATAISDSGLILTGNDSDAKTAQHTVQWSCH